MKPRPPRLWSCPVCAKPTWVPGARCSECRRKGRRIGTWFAALLICALVLAPTARADDHQPGVDAAICREALLGKTAAEITYGAYLGLGRGPREPAGDKVDQVS